MGIFVDREHYVLVLLALADDLAWGGGVDEFACGMRLDLYVDEMSLVRQRVRTMVDILNDTVRDLYNKDDEVHAWVEGLGGLAAYQQMLVGKNAFHQFMNDLREVKAEDGMTPILDARQHVEGMESATGYDSYAVQVHREVLTKQAFGEIDDDVNTNPSWEGHESNIDLKPFWWRNIFPGKASKQLCEDRRYMQSKHQFKQLTTANKGCNLHLDIRVGGLLPAGHSDHEFFPRFVEMEKAGGFKSLPRDAGNWFLLQDHPDVKDLIDRFYNDPKSLTWFMDPFTNGDYQRLCCAKRTQQGKILWLPMSKASKKSFDYWLDNEGETKERWYCRAVYAGNTIYAYKKQGEEHYEVRAFRECSQTGWLALWKKAILPWKEWIDMRNKLVAKGAKDTYFGRPWAAKDTAPKQRQSIEL